MRLAYVLIKVTLKDKICASEGSLGVQPSARQSTPSKPSTSYSTCKSSTLSTTCQSTPAHSPTAQPTKVNASLQPQAGSETCCMSLGIPI